MITTEAGVILPGEVAVSQQWYFKTPSNQVFTELDVMMEVSRRPFFADSHNHGVNFDSTGRYFEAEREFKERQRCRRASSPRAMPPWPVQSKERGPNGHRLCRCGCGKEVPPPKRAWFSQKCYRETCLKHNWSSLRHHVFERDKHTCVKCGATANLECDHIIPLAEGGTHAPENLRTLCRSCHQKETAALQRRLRYLANPTLT